MVTTKDNTVMDIYHLLSPPESAPRHNFKHPLSPIANYVEMSRSDHERFSKQAKASASIEQGRETAGPLSPPDTPGNRRVRDERKSSFAEDVYDENTEGSSTVPDPVLYPHARGDSFNSSQPLFTQPEPVVAANVKINLDEIVTNHIAMHMDRFVDCVSQPTRDEYLLAASCVPIVSSKYSQNPGKWYRQEQRILNERFGAANRARRHSANKILAKLAPAPISGVKKQHPSTSPRANRPPRAPRAPKRTPQSKVLHTFDGTGTPSPKRVIGTSREDTDFDALPDYAPPTSTLPGNNAKALKTDWKGQMLDLSRDPHRHLLHDAEVNLAATLRLSCATYLCSKRRIFMGRLDALRIGKEFRKTDSQQACKIDVNKASKLWAAYDRVGWFRTEHFSQFL